MRSLNRTAQAGTLESGDIMIMVGPGPAGSGIVIALESIVLTRYGQAIRQKIMDIAVERELTDIYIKAVDRGALDCTITARMLTALGRAGAADGEELL